MTETSKAAMAGDLVFLPLGGAGEIGLNLYLYGLGDDWLMVDCGISFGDERTPGIDVLVPDIGFIAARRERLRGIVITHAHEDHIGALPYIWRALRCPVYATPFAAAFLRRKMVDDGGGETVPIHEIPQGGRFSVGPFDLEFITVTHSIPEANALALHTPHGVVVHSGDFKLDPDPLIGDVTDEARLTQIGDAGVLAFCCDSTNAMVEGEAGSEAAVRESLSALFGTFDGRIAVTCFASNLARVESIAVAAAANGRQVAIVGRSLVRIDSIARGLGYLKDIPAFVPEDSVGNVPADKMVIIATGCQGEQNAALSRIAMGSHRHVSLGEGDVAIFSSRIIPGNEKPLARLHTALMRRGIQVITETDHFVHVSGHPPREDLRRMYGWVRPRISVPIHGEWMHMSAHAALARSLDVPKPLQIENGDMLRLAPGEPAVIEKIELTGFGIDAGRVTPLDGDVVRARSRIRFEGEAVVSLAVDSRGRLIADPKVSAPTLLDETEDRGRLDEIADKIADAIDAMKKSDRDDDLLVEEVARVALRRAFRESMRKRPQTVVHLMRV